MEDVLGSLALTHPTRIMVIEPTNDSDNCSPSTQSMQHKEGMARMSSNEGDWLSKGYLTPGQDVLLAVSGLYYSRRDGTKGVWKGSKRKGIVFRSKHFG